MLEITEGEYESRNEAIEAAYYADVHVFRAEGSVDGPDPTRRPWIGVRAWSGSSQVFQLVKHADRRYAWIELTRTEPVLSDSGYHRYVDLSVRSPGGS